LYVTWDNSGAPGYQTIGIGPTNFAGYSQLWGPQGSPVYQSLYRGGGTTWCYHVLSWEGWLRSNTYVQPTWNGANVLINANFSIQRLRDYP
jgi:hypothetical protein